jgi:hypothetical protein
MALRECQLIKLLGEGMLEWVCKYVRVYTTGNSDSTEISQSIGNTQTTCHAPVLYSLCLGGPICVFAAPPPPPPSPQHTVDHATISLISFPALNR